MEAKKLQQELIEAQERYNELLKLNKEMAAKQLKVVKNILKKLEDTKPYLWSL